MSAVQAIALLWPLWLALAACAVVGVGERRLAALLDDEADA